MRRLVPLLIACTLAGACKKDSSKDGGDSAGAKKMVGIELSLDGKPVATLDAAKLGAWAPLGSFLPRGSQAPDGWEVGVPMTKVRLNSSRLVMKVKMEPAKMPGRSIGI